MAGTTRILLCGNSIILAGVGISLARVRGFKVTGVVSPQPSEAELEALSPDVVLFDIENGRPDSAFTLLESRPDLLLLGISPDGNVVRQWSGRQYSQLSTKDLTALIEAASHGEGPCDERLATTRHRTQG